MPHEVNGRLAGVAGADAHQLVLDAVAAHRAKPMQTLLR
jgi:hypothetical protein